MEWELVYDENGGTPGQDAEELLRRIAGSGVTDLFVVSHGWNTDRNGARDLYDAMFPLLRQAAVAEPGRVGPAGFVRLYWPSIWFPETPATVPERAGSLQDGSGPVTGPSAGTTVLSGAAIAESMRPGFGEQDRVTIAELGRLIDEGLAGWVAGEPEAVQQQRLRAIQAGLRTVAGPAGIADEDSGERTMLFGDPARNFEQLGTQFGSLGPAASTQGVGDLFGRAFEGAKDALRALSYTVMKKRAGAIGHDGLGPHLARLHELAPGLRVHLLGHSFGARLVSFALSGTGAAAASPVASLLLIQGAFSHFAFSHARDNQFGESGALHGFADRVHGPRVATFSRHDRAVGTWYPRASLFTGDSTQAGAVTRWGAMGAGGYQAVSPVVDRVLADDGSTGGEIPVDGFVRVDAVRVIKDVRQSSFSGAHSDIRHPQIARLAISVAGARLAPTRPVP